MKVKDLETNDILFMIARSRGDKGTCYQVVDEDVWAPYWIEADQVNLEDSQVPSRWIDSWSNSSIVSTYPEFICEGFWEAYFDSEPDAIKKNTIL